MYYLNLQEQLHFKRQNDRSKEEHRIVHLPEFSQTLEAVSMRHPAQLQAWCEVLEKLRRFLTSQDELKVKLTYVRQREDVVQRSELTAGQYIGAVVYSYKQIKHSLSQLDHNLFALGSIWEQVSFLQPYSPFHFSTWLYIPYLMGESLLN